MNSEKTPLVQKLILVVLTLILVCLVVLIAQNRSRPAQSFSDVNTTTEPPPPQEDLIANNQTSGETRVAPKTILPAGPAKDPTTEPSPQRQPVRQQPSVPSP